MAKTDATPRSKTLYPITLRGVSNEIWSPAKYGLAGLPALLISVRPGALELNKNLNYRGLADSNPVVDIDTDKDVLGLIVKNLR